MAGIEDAVNYNTSIRSSVAVLERGVKDTDDGFSALGLAGSSLPGGPGAQRQRTLISTIMRAMYSRMFCRTFAPAAMLFLLVGAGIGQNTARITLDQAIDLALAHNHSLKATRTLILQNQAQEITANLRPNPTLNFDSQFLPIFQPSEFSADALSEIQQFDVGLGYLFERGRKRQHRLQAARDQTAVQSAQVSDAERTLTFNVAQQFVAVLLAESTLRFALLDLKSFEDTVD